MRAKGLAVAAFLVPSLLIAAPQPGELVTRGPRDAKRLALTFDDGPGPHTRQFLDLLDRYNVKATFFMLAQQVKYRPEIAREVARRGHEIGSHTFDHANYRKVHQDAVDRNPDAPEKATAEALARLIDDMNKSRTIIEAAVGRKLTLLRMPNGVDRPWVKDAAKKTGFVLVNWTFGADWTKGDEKKMEDDYIEAIKPGAILLLHDGGGKRERTLRLTERILEAARQGGYEIVPVGEMIGTSTKP